VKKSQATAVMVDHSDARMRNICRRTADSYLDRAEALYDSAAFVYNGTIDGIRTERLTVPGHPPVFRGSIDIPLSTGVTFTDAFQYLKDLERRCEFDAMCEDSVFLHRYEGESIMSYQSFRGMYGLDGREFYLIGFERWPSADHVVLAGGSPNAAAPHPLPSFTPTSKPTLRALTSTMERLKAARTRNSRAALKRHHTGHIYLASYDIELDERAGVLRLRALSQTDLGRLPQWIQNMVTTKHVTSLRRIAENLTAIAATARRGEGETEPDGLPTDASCSPSSDVEVMSTCTWMALASTAVASSDATAVSDGDGLSPIHNRGEGARADGAFCWDDEGLATEAEGSLAQQVHCLCAPALMDGRSCVGGLWREGEGRC